MKKNQCNVEHGIPSFLCSGILLLVIVLSLSILSFDVAFAGSSPRDLRGYYIDGRIELTWQKPDTATDPLFYQLYRTANGGDVFFPHGGSWGADSTHYADIDIELNATYRYCVTAVYVDLDTTESEPSDTVEVQTGSDPGPPQPPYGLGGYYSNRRILLYWSPPLSSITPSSYNVYRRAEAESTFAILASLTVTSYEDTDILLGETYEYYTTAIYDDSVESEPSNLIVVQSGNPLPPRSLAGRIVENGAALLEWQPPDVTLFDGFYVVYRATDPETLFSMIGYSGVTSFTDPTIDLGTTSHYYVTALHYYAGDTTESIPSNIIDLPDNQVGVRFVSIPPSVAIVGQLYTYYPTVITNPPGVNVCFRLAQAPEGMVLDSASGRVEWTPTSPKRVQVGIQARVCDSLRIYATQTFDILVSAGIPGRVEGTVRTQDGWGLASVRVKLFDVARGQFTQRTYTDQWGNYEFPIVSPSTYLVRAHSDSAEMYASEWYNGTARIEDATLVVVAGDDTVTIDFTLKPGSYRGNYLLSGTVVNLQDTVAAPVVGAQVLVFQSVRNRLIEDLLDGDDDDHELVRVTYTDFDGHYGAVLPEGDYIVGVLKEEYYPQFYNRRGSPLEATIVQLAHDTSGIDFQLVPNVDGIGRLTGMLFSASDSSEIRGLVLGFHKAALDSPYSGIVLFTYTDSTGRYLLSRLPNGYFTILALPRGEFVPTFYNQTGGTAFLDDASAVAVLGDSVAGLDIFVRHDSTIGLNGLIGHVRTNSSSPTRISLSQTPAAGAIVTIINSQTKQPVAGTITGDDGGYVVTGLQSGDFDAVFQKLGETTVSLPFTISGSGISQTTLTLDAEFVSAVLGHPTHTEPIPARAELYQNHPNPFNPVTEVRFRIPARTAAAGGQDGGFTTLKVYDLLGREVATLVDEVKQPGEHTVKWDAGNHPSGVYFYRLTAGRFTDIKKMMLVK